MHTPSTSFVFNSWRHDLYERDGYPSELAKRDWSSLLSIELFPGCRLGDKTLEVPKDYLPSGTMRRDASRRLDPFMGGELIKGTTSKAVISQREENIRRALFILWLPHNGKRGDEGFGPSSWLTRCNILLRVVRHLLKSAPPSLGNIWSLLRHLPKELYAISKNKRTHSDIETIMSRLALGAERGFLPDWFAKDDGMSVKPSTIEASHKDVPEPKMPRGTLENDQRPFPDEFVVRIIGRAMWVFENVGDQCVECWRSLEEAEAANPGLSQEQLKVLKNRLITDFKWQLDGFDKLPFSVKQRINKQSYEQSDHWPPKNLSSLHLFVGLIQSLAFTTVAFCTAARHHELTGALPNVTSASEGKLHSNTRKMEKRFGGRDRDWPLPPMGDRALALQERLASVIRPPGENHLWVQMKTHAGAGRGGPLANMTEPMVSAVEHLGLQAMIDGRPNAHRWRHTVVRLIALSLVQSTQVLQDLLGHKDLEALLHYLFSSDDLLGELTKVAEEASQVIAASAIEQTIRGQTGDQQLHV